MRLNEYLDKNKISPAHLAQELDIHAQTLYNYLSTGRSPKLNIAKKIIDYSKGEVSLEDLIDWNPVKICSHCGAKKRYRVINKKNSKKDLVNN